MSRAVIALKFLSELMGLYGVERAIFFRPESLCRRCTPQGEGEKERKEGGGRGPRKSTHWTFMDIEKNVVKGKKICLFVILINSFSQKTSVDPRDMISKMNKQHNSVVEIQVVS